MARSTAAATSGSARAAGGTIRVALSVPQSESLAKATARSRYSGMPPAAIAVSANRPQNASVV